MTFLLALAHAPAGHFWLWTGISAAVALAAFVRGLTRLRRARMMEDTPTALIRSAAQGYVELQGFARALSGPPIIAPLTGGRCCWWRYRIDYRDRQGDNKGWGNVESGVSEDLFELGDRSGECVIDPAGARVLPDKKEVWYGPSMRPPWGPKMGRGVLRALTSSYRYTEERLDHGTLLYAVGMFRTQRGSEANDPQAELRDLLAKWKQDPRMMALLDVNKDGRVDSTEWDAARRMAQQKVQEAALAEMPGPDVSVLSKPQDRRPFILSALLQAELAGRDRRNGALSLLLALLAGGLAAFLLAQRGLL